MKIKNTLLIAAAALSLITVGATAANADSVITVKSGDTLAKIAQEHYTTVSDLQKLNNLQNVNLIFVGQQLKVDGNAQPQQVQPAQNVKTTSPGASQAQKTVAPVAKTQAPNVQNNNQNQSTSNSSNLSGSEAAARAWIAARESGGNYGARNGQYVGKYQLSASYLNGDYSPANQDRVADQYVQSRYGSWTNAKAHWEANGWY